jgi:acetyltransferase
MTAVEAIMKALPFWLNWKPRQHVRGSGLAASGSFHETHDLWRARNGSTITLRAAGPDDGPIMQALVRGLSMKSRYQRFFYPVHELTPDLLARFTHNDPAQAVTLLAVAGSKGQETAIGMAQYAIGDHAGRYEFAVVVADAWQREGIGTRLIHMLIRVARGAGIERIEGDILADNVPMLRLMLAMDFTLSEHEDGAHLRKASKLLSLPERTSALSGVLVAKAPCSAAHRALIEY